VTFEPPEDADGLRVYAELMTMFDNPKFPDQLSALGGDKDNYRLRGTRRRPTPRSFFGVTRVVAHDGPEPPRVELGHLRPLFAGPEPAALADVADRYAAVVEAAVRAWAADRATDDDVRWLDGLLRRGLLGNDVRLTPRLEALGAEYRDTEKGLALPRVVPGVADCGPGFEQPVLARGDCTRPGEPVPRRYLEALEKPGDRFRPTGSGRLELAERFAAPDNPLTARVMVNRVWHHLFGTGLVRTPDDFGHGGEPPSHPELLDYLAARFVEEGWSVKRLVRTLVLTQTFREESRPSPLAKEVDPLDGLLQHYPARRLEGEGIRDSILTASGRLDRGLFGPSVQPYREKENADRRLFPGPLDGDGRRSVYVKNNLMETPAFLGRLQPAGGQGRPGPARRDRHAGPGPGPAQRPIRPPAGRRLGRAPRGPAGRVGRRPGRAPVPRRPGTAPREGRTGALRAGRRPARGAARGAGRRGPPQPGGLAGRRPRAVQPERVRLRPVTLGM